jgi:hypothetical protein
MIVQDFLKLVNRQDLGRLRNPLAGENGLDRGPSPCAVSQFHSIYNMGLIWIHLYRRGGLFLEAPVSGSKVREKLNYYAPSDVSFAHEWAGSCRDRAADLPLWR